MGRKFIIICASTNHMLNADRILRENHINTELIPTPSQYGSICSTSIMIDEESREKAELLLKENQVNVRGIHEYKERRFLGITKGLSASKEFTDILKKVEQGFELTREDIIKLLRTENPREMEALYNAADKVRKEIVGDVVEIRAAIEFSNYCIKNCNYCGIRRDNKIVRYRMTEEQIMEGVREIQRLGIKTVILQSGEDPWYTPEKILSILRRIKRETGMRITLSIGERSKEEYKLFREAGANNYLLKIETVNEELFKRVHPDDDYHRRKECSVWLRELGYVNGSGNIIGLPGQTAEDIADDILYFKDMKIHMIGIGPFLPAKGTPYENLPPGSVDMTLKAVAVTRLVCKNVFIPATTALATLDPDGHVKALKAGANTIMLISTPPGFRENYQIYSNKNMVDIHKALNAIKRAERKIPKYINLDVIA